MRESKCNSSDSLVPGDGPVSSILDNFGRFNHTKREPEVPEFLNSEVVIGGGELSTENSIQIDGLSEMMFFHSESGNSGHLEELVSKHLVALGSVMYTSMSLSYFHFQKCWQHLKNATFGIQRL